MNLQGYLIQVITLMRHILSDHRCSPVRLAINKLLTERIINLCTLDVLHCFNKNRSTGGFYFETLYFYKPP